MQFLYTSKVVYKVITKCFLFVQFIYKNAILKQGL